MSFNVEDYSLQLKGNRNQYITAESKLYIGLSEIKNFKCNTLVYLPTKAIKQPYMYLFIDNYKIYDYLLRLDKFRLNIQATLPDNTLLHMKNLRIKEGHFDVTGIKKGYLLVHFPKFTFKYITNTPIKCNKITFRISDSELLKSEINQYPEYRIEIIELEHLGIKSIKTDEKIENNLLHIEFVDNIDSYYLFMKNVKPIIELILYLTSFAERRRLTWSSFICSDTIEHYNCRRVFSQDKKVLRLVSDEVFNEFLSNSLQRIQFNDIGYYLSILNLIVTANKYPTNIKIILFNTALETILKKRFNKKRDKYKTELIEQLNIVTFDIEQIKDMVNIRNDITHGDEVSSHKQFKFSKSWRILLERMVLNELGWNDLSMTDVNYVKGQYIPGLV